MIKERPRISQRKKEYTIAQKKAHLLFEREGIDYIPVENVKSVYYGAGKYYIVLSSDGTLILKVNSEKQYL